MPELYGIMRDIAKVDIDAVYKKPETFWNAYECLFEEPYPFSRDRVRKEVDKNAVADVTKTRKEFSWKTEYNIQEGLRSVYEYAKEVSSLL